MAKQYTFNYQQKRCGIDSGEELLLIRANSWQWIYKQGEADLVIERLGSRIITATLKNVSEEISTVANGDYKDYGQAVGDEEKKGYVLKYGLPHIFYLFKDDYQENEPWTFNFVADWHLVMKDKDQCKPYYGYQGDYTASLSAFVFETLNRHIRPEHGQIVAIPGELGEAGAIGKDNGYTVNHGYYGYEEANAGYDFSKETAENGKQKHRLLPALVITFLPTCLENYRLKRGQQLTGTTGLKKIWEVFGLLGVPIVLKCYRAFVYILLYRHYRSIYNQISSITELSPSIDQREVGSSNLLVYFNMPWLTKKTPYKAIIV